MIEVEDAASLARAYEQNRRYLEPWEPVRPDAFFQAEWHEKEIAGLLSAAASGLSYPLVLVEQERVIGRVNVSGIVRGAFQSANLGYWIAQDKAGAGLMTKAVSEAVSLARDDLHLHRLQAGVLPHNSASRGVLVRNEFVSYGLAPRYLQIAGRWQDHELFQRILHE